MGKRGPKPKPTVLKALSGSSRANSNPNEPTPARYVPEPPEDIAEDKWMRKEWDRMSTMLYTAGLLTTADGEALSMLVRHIDEARRAQIEINRSGMIVRNNGGKTVMLNPWIKVRNDANAMVKHMLAEFGMTPAARTRIEVQYLPPPEATNVDPVDEMLGEG